MEENEIRSNKSQNMSIIEELNLYVNSKIAKIIATGVVMCFVVYHGFLRAVDGKLKNSFRIFIIHCK